LNENKYSDKIKKFLKDYYWDEILQLATEYPDSTSLKIQYPLIERFDRKLAFEVLNHPAELIGCFEDGLKEIDLPIETIFVNVFVRITDLPTKIRIGELRSEHLGKLISIEGMIRKATEVRPRITKAAFQCMRCGHTTITEQNGFKFEEPFAGCENETCGKRGPFKIVIEDSSFVDAQKLQIQEPPEDLRGTQAQSLDVDVENDLAGIVLPGERVLVTGILKSRQKILKDGKSTFYDIFLETNSIERMGISFDEIEISQEEEKEIIDLSKDALVYKKMIASIAPTINGLDDVKEAMLLQLFSGVPKTTPDMSHLRGDIHILLLGDPSKGKTKLMKSSQMRSPRAVFTSGKATTAGGLTAVVVKDTKFGGDCWVVEGGAMVMADRGIAYIDEADKMRPTDRDALHEAMEQQQINLAKAGIIATLNSRTAVLMSANPKYGKFDMFESIAEQIEMPPSLLSRFDLIFILLDTPDPAADSKISDHILKTHMAGEMLLQREKSAKSISSHDLKLASDHARPEISPELFRKYVAYSRKKIFPILSAESINHIHNFYLDLRKAGASSKIKSIPITTRQEEALIRLAEASARVRLDQEVTLEDAKRATRLMLTCLRAVGIDPKTGEMDTTVWNAGISKEQMTVIKALKDILQERSRQYQNGKVPISDVVTAAELKGISRERAEANMNKMAQKGDLIKWGSEHIKLVF